MEEGRSTDPWRGEGHWRARRSTEGHAHAYAPRPAAILGPYRRRESDRRKTTEEVHLADARRRRGGQEDLGRRSLPVIRVLLLSFSP